MTHADVYARVSQDREKTGLATGRQVEDAEKLCAMRGWPIAERFVDDDVSAAGQKRRPEFEKLLAKIKDGRTRIVVAWSIDRITRNRADTVRFIEACQEHQVMLALCRGSDIDMATPMGRLMADQLAGYARFEIEVKSDRQRRAHEQAAAAGKPPMRRAFGYHASGEKSPDEAEAVRELFARFLAGASVSSLVRWLADAGHTTTTGKAWDRAGVRKLLRNVRYAGIRVHRGIEVGRGTWDGIVTEDEVRSAAALLADPARREQLTGNARRHLGSGLYRCGRCQLATATVSIQYSKGVRSYRCLRCWMVRAADPVDAKVLGLIRARLARPDVADVLAGPDVDLTGLRTQRRALQLRLDALADDIDLDERTLARRSKALRDRLDAIDERLAEAATAAPLSKIFDSPDPVAAFDALDVAGKQRVIDFFCTVTVYPGRGGAVLVDPRKLSR